MSGVSGAYRWSDCGYHSGFRIQVHWRADVFRLVNAEGREQCRGTREACALQLSQIVEREQFLPLNGTAIVLVHGLLRPAWSMSSLHNYLGRVWPEATTVLYQYASTTATVELHAQYLTEFLEYFRSASTVHFVGHSLGNIVLRRAYRMAELDLWKPLPFGKHVMLGPPNQGSQIARKLAMITPIRLISGPSFLQLGRDWEQFKHELATPPCQFGIIAGNLGLANHFNFLLDEANDVLVNVNETRLDGAADFLEVSVSHTWLMSYLRVQRLILSFLQNGRFMAEQGS